MTNDLRIPIEIDQKHSLAICAEIGRRLRSELNDESQPVAQNLSRLMAELEEVDRLST